MSALASNWPDLPDTFALPGGRFSPSLAGLESLGFQPDFLYHLPEGIEGTGASETWNRWLTRTRERVIGDNAYQFCSRRSFVPPPDRATTDTRIVVSVQKIPWNLSIIPRMRNDAFIVAEHRLPEIRLCSRRKASPCNTGAFVQKGRGRTHGYADAT